MKALDINVLARFLVRDEQATCRNHLQDIQKGGVRQDT